MELPVLQQALAESDHWHQGELLRENARSQEQQQHMIQRLRPSSVICRSSNLTGRPRAPLCFSLAGVTRLLMQAAPF
jgi:hypothetical protein